MKSPAELEAEGRAKLDEFLAGRRSGEGILWHPKPPSDDRPRCDRCGEPIEIEGAHVEELGVFSPYPRVEWRCDPNVVRTYRARCNAQARAAGKPEPLFGTGPDFSWPVGTTVLKGQ